MADSTTNLDLMSASQSGKEITANALFDALSPALIYGRRASACAGLTWGYYGGVTDSPGTPTQIDNDTIALTGSATNYLERKDSDGTVVKNTSGWTGAGYTRLYKIVCGSSSVTSYEDWRTVEMALSSLASYFRGAALFTEVALTGTRNGSNTVFICTRYPQMVLKNAIPQVTLADGSGNTADIAITGSGPYTVTFAAAPSATDSLIALTT